MGETDHNHSERNKLSVEEPVALLGWEQMYWMETRWRDGGGTKCHDGESNQPSHEGRNQMQQRKGKFIVLYCVMLINMTKYNIKITWKGVLLL